MPIRVVRLGTPRHRGERLRIGTVRRPPRGLRKERHAIDNWYDIWLPNLAPSAALLATAKSITRESGWRRFAMRYEKEMATPENGRILDLLAALSHHVNFSVGCYCEDERRCHRSVLKTILKRRGALVVGRW